MELAAWVFVVFTPAWATLHIMDTFAATRAIIETRWPTVWDAIEHSTPNYHLERVQDTPDETIICSGIHLTSAYNRKAEARSQAQLISEDAETATVYGLGLGDLPRVLLERKHLQALRVVIMNPAIVKTAIELFDQTDWLRDRRVSLLLARNATQIEKPFAVCPATLRLASDDAARTRDWVVLELEKNYQQEHFRARKQEFDNTLKTVLPLLRQDGDVASLFQTALGKIGIVVAGGPSAAEIFDWIKTNRNKLNVVAVSTALLPLDKRGIVPDVLVAVDPHPYLENHLLGADLDNLKHVPFVYTPIVHQKVLKLWKGPRLTTYIHHPRYEELAQNLPKGFLYCSGTVTHSAIDLAIKMGAEKVVLAGVDFCFPGDNSHVDGASPAHKIEIGTFVHPWAVNGLGERVTSNTAMIGYLRDLEQYIKLQKTIQFFNTGRSGSVIAGAPWLEGKALDDFCS